MKKYFSLALLLTLVLSTNSTVCADGILGDVNDDGILTASDASAVLTYVLDKNTPLNSENAKVFGNGDITASNSAAILAKVLDDSFVYPNSAEDMPVREQITETTTATVMGIDLNDYTIIQEYNFEDIKPGVYTEPIVVGSMTIPAYPTSPVYIEETDVTLNGRHYTRCMKSNCYTIMELQKVKGSDYLSFLFKADFPNGHGIVCFNTEGRNIGNGTIEIDGIVHGSGGLLRRVSSGDGDFNNGFNNFLINRTCNPVDETLSIRHSSSMEYCTTYALFTLDRK